MATVTGANNGVMTLYKVGAASITVTDGTINNNASPLAVTVGLAPTAALSLGAATTTPTAGAGDNLTITATDAYGNTATGYTGSHSLTFGGASAIGTHNPTVSNATGTATNFGTATAITFTNGVATVTGANNGVMTLYKAGAASITVTDGTINNGTGLAVTVSPTTPNKLAYNPNPPSTGTGGVTLASFGVSVEDTYGNIETTGNTGSTDTITLSLATKPAGGAFSSASNTYTNVAAVNGTATFSSVALNNTAGSYTFTATDTQSGDTGVTPVTSAPATVISVSHIALVGTPSSATEQGGTSLTINAPSGLTTGDLLLAQVTARDNLTTAGVTTITAPTGWTEVPTASFTGNATIFQFAYTCVVGSAGCATSSTSWTWSWPCTAGSCAGAGGVADGSGGIFQFSGVNTSTPIDVAGNSGKGTTTPATAPAVTTTQANDEIVAFFASGGTANFSGQTPTGTNAPSSPNYAVTSANSGKCNGTSNACTSVAAGVATTAVQSSAGSTGTYTLPGANTTYAWIASTIALKGF